MLKMIEAYHPADNTPLFIMLKIAGEKGHIESDGLNNNEFVVWPGQMIDDFLYVANEMSIGEIASYGLCITECIFCDVLRQRIHNTGGY